MSDLLVIMPAYNEEKNIVRVVQNITENYPQYDYVVVNDGSLDGTLKVCREHHFNVLDLPVNLGLAGAFQAGLRYAWENGYRYALQYDGDGQHRAEFIEPMKKKIDEGYDIVIGSRFIEKKKPVNMKMLGSSMISAAIRLTTGAKVKDPTSGMRMFRQEMIHEFALELNYGPEPDTISYLLKQGASIAEIQVEMDERIAGETYLRPVNALKYMSEMLFSILIIQNFRKRDRRYANTEEGDNS